MAVTPDIAGFRAAQARLAAQFGTDVTFLVPAAPEDITWPDGTTFDPESGLPFDPVIEPTSGGDASEVTVSVQIVHRTDNAEVSASAIGWVEGASMALIITNDDIAPIKLATAVVVYGERQRIVSFRPDGIQNSIDRWVCFTEGM